MLGTPAAPASFVRTCILAVCAIAAWCADVALAQDYPNRAVKIIVPFAAGGPADVYARFLAQRLQEALGQPFVVDDRPGGGSVVGTDAAAKSAPDGYTLLLMSNTHTVNESLMPNKPFALTRDFVPVAPINYSDLVMVVHPSVAFKAMAGVDIVHVPYRGSSGARTDIIGGQVQMMFDAVTTMSEHVKAGQVRALGTSGKTRSTVLPDVPTVAETVPGYEATIWLGIVAPKGTPPAIVTRLNAEITKIVRRPDVRRDWAAQGAVAMTMTPDEFGKYISDDIVKWERIVKISGAKPDQ
ncbi:MAG: tripartite tricarboxylate transporter substrate binding protein [Betaproteobacteria bacterium]|nr:MAG: tripartite tricarboxylate transporter substrate binding protein [Betaproteobacteria bacterium]